MGSEMCIRDRLADGGSTKCDWILLDNEGEIVFKTRTEGLNPAIFDISLLEIRLKKNEELALHREKIETVHFFGAGCGTSKPTEMLTKVFEEYFVNADVVVREDMVAAVYAATAEPGIVCILGTGSNSCYFCLLYTSPSPRDLSTSRMPSSA